MRSLVVVFTLAVAVAGLTPPAVAAPRDVAAAGQTPPSAKPSRERQRIHGKIQSIEGSTLKFETDDGRALTVDVSRVESRVRRGLTPGEGVTVIAHEWTGPTTVRTNYVQQDSSDPSHGGRIAPSASPRSR